MLFRSARQAQQVEGLFERYRRQAHALEQGGRARLGGLARAPLTGRVDLYLEIFKNLKEDNERQKRRKSGCLSGQEQ